MLEKEAHRLVWEDFLKGDEQALLHLYQQHYLGLLNYGITIIDERDFVHDCFVDMLIRLWEKRSSLPSVENVRSYLMTALRRRILDNLELDTKRQAKQEAAQQGNDAYQWSYEEYLVKLQSDQRLKAKIENALKKLTERQRELVRLKFFEDLDYDDISERCGITKRTAYNIVHDAITVLKEELGGEEGGAFVLPFFLLLALSAAAPLLQKKI